VTVGNNSGGVYNITLDARCDGVDVRDTMANGWNGWNCFYCECLLGGEVSSSHCSSDKTHVKDPKNIFETQPPGGDLLFSFLRVEAPTDRIPFIPLDEVPLNICYGSAIESNMMDGSRWVSLVQLTPIIDL